MKTTEVLAMGYRYPNPSAAAMLRAAVEAESNAEVKRHMRKFLDEVGALSLGAWEELHTATLDLNAPFVPYVGHVEWGDNYRRGAFMADLKRSMEDTGVDLGGELPDHIEPILRYLAATDQPLDDLVEVLPRTVITMAHTLESAAPDNPYCHLMAATVAIAANRPVSIGGRK